MKRIIIRLDDICPDMNYDRFAKVRNILIKNSVKPLIGIIPCNKDEKLRQYRYESGKEDDDIWSEIKELQDKQGWEIALHGYEHSYKTNDCGILRMSLKSEFAGIPYDEQVQSINRGKERLDSLGLKCKAFMAPSHSFDYNTIKALAQAGINVITDGRGVFPYKLEGCLMMPAPSSIYRNLPFGIYTVYLHTNTMTDIDIERIEKFIVRENKNIISFSEGIETYYSIHDNKWINIVNLVSDAAMRIGLVCAQVLSNMRRIRK